MLALRKSILKPLALITRQRFFFQRVIYKIFSRYTAR